MGNTCCLYGVPLAKFSKVQDVYAFLGEILAQLVKKVEYLEGDKHKIFEKLTRMCFHMHVLKLVAL